MPTSRLQEIQEKLGDEYRSYPLFLQSLDADQALIVLRATPRLKVLVAGESDFTRKLDKMGLSDEVKTGDQHFDDRYVIKCEQPGLLQDVFTPEVREKLHQLEPFTEFEMTGREYRLLTKQENVEKSLELLADIVDLTSA